MYVYKSKFHIPYKNKPIKVGYAFKSGQKISALLLIRGWADSPEKDEFVPGEPIKIGYWLENVPFQQHIPQDQIIEFVLEPGKNRLFWFKTKKLIT